MYILAFVTTQLDSTRPLRRRQTRLLQRSLPRRTWTSLISCKLRKKAVIGGALKPSDRCTQQWCGHFNINLYHVDAHGREFFLPRVHYGSYFRSTFPKIAYGIYTVRSGRWKSMALLHTHPRPLCIFIQFLVYSLAFSLVKQFVLDQFCCIYLPDLYTRHMNISLKFRTQAFSFFIIFNGSKRVGCFIRVHQVGIISLYPSILTKKFDNYNHVHMDKEVGRKFTLIFYTYNLKRKV